MFSYTLLTPPNDSLSFRATLMSFDDQIHILADPTWNGKNHNDINFLEKHLKKVKIIILSHSTPEFISGYGLICQKFPTLMNEISVYSTLPVSQLGRLSTVEFYRSNRILGPINTAFLDLDDIDDYFDKIISLKYLQLVNLFDGKLTITPYISGHTLGGAFWLIIRKFEKVIYAPAWNHSKDSILNSVAFISSTNGTPHSQMLRPTVLITNSDLGTIMSYKKKTEKFLLLVDGTLSKGGTVLIPTSISGRFLELFYLIDNHLRGAPIPVYFLSYSGTNILTFASNFLDWTSSKIFNNINTYDFKSSSENKLPFDPFKVDLLLDPDELIQLSGPKIVFCSGINFSEGDLSFESLRHLSHDEKTTILLTEKSSLSSDDAISSILYSEWYKTSMKLNGKIEDGFLISLKKQIQLDNFHVEELLKGQELIDFQTKINLHRKEKLSAKVREKKNKNLLESNNFNDEDSSDDDENVLTNDDKIKKNSSDSNKLNNMDPNVNIQDCDIVVDKLSIHEAFVTDHINQALENSKPLDLRITYKLKPKQATFPYISSNHKKKSDDYGEIIKSLDFQKTNTSVDGIIIEGKKKYHQSEKNKWMNIDNNNTNYNIASRNRSHSKAENKSDKLTPRDILNNQILQKNLSSLLNPKKKVPIHDSFYSSISKLLNIRCGLSYVDLSGKVDIRSLNIIVASLKPYNLLLLPDTSFNITDNESNNHDGVSSLKSMFIQQQKKHQDEKNVNDSKNILNYLSIPLIRNAIPLISSSSATKMKIIEVDFNKKIGIGDNINGFSLNNFEVKLDDTIVDSLKWKVIDGSYKVARVYGTLEFHVANKKKHKLIDDTISSSTLFVLKKKKTNLINQSTTKNSSQSSDPTLNNNPGSILAIGNVRLLELKKKLLSRNLIAEFKSNGTLVVNNEIEIKKLSYNSLDTQDTGDIIIDGRMGPLYYEIKNCIKESLAYI